MKKGLIKAGVLTGIFIIALFLFGKMMNQNQVDRTMEMKAASLPILILYDEGQPLNELHGYTQKMEITAMWDAILPISSRKEIPFVVKTYGQPIEEIQYEIRSRDGGRLISDGTITDFKEEDDQIQTGIPAQKLIEEMQEYQLVIKLKRQDELIYYYTRIEDEQDCHVEETVKFALEINEQTFSKSGDKLGSYWEPDVTGNNSSLHQINIHSSVAQAKWGNLECSRLSTPVPSVKEINSSYNIIMLEYVVTSTGNNGEMEYYNVKEVYRIRYTSERMYLLSFEREMNQIFYGENNPLYDTLIQLGIRSTEVDYLQNEMGTVTAFVQEGDLWSYNLTSNRLSEVFSFRGQEGIDARENWNKHGIRLISIDESGSLDYVVYGYMNRGEHEGKTGISVMRYDSLTNTNEELLFVSYNKPYSFLKAELGGLLYKSQQNSLYFILDGTVYRINLDTLETEELVKNLPNDSFAASKSNRYAAWVSAGNSQKAKEITVIDMEKGKIKTLTAKDGKSLRVLGFLQEDFVYGIADDIIPGGTEELEQSVPMYAIRIIEPGTLTQLKEYQKSGYYITSVEFNNGVMAMNRVVSSENGYAAAQPDSIVSRSLDIKDTGIVHTTVTEEKQTQVQLDLKTKCPEKRPLAIVAKLVVNEQEKQVALSSETARAGYLAYAHGEVMAKTTDVSEAIQSADENMGVVVDENLDYVWKRARKSIQAVFPVQSSEADMDGSSFEKCYSALLKSAGAEANVGELLRNGDTIQEIWDSLMPDKKLLEINGGSVEQMLYYVNCGIPVAAVKASGETAIFVGYDMLNVAVYEPVSGNTSYHPLTDMQEEYEKIGNKYYTYIQ